MNDDAYASIWTHVEELRRTLIRIIGIIAIGVILCFFCYQPILSFLSGPFQSLYSTQSELQTEQFENLRIANYQSEPKRFTLPGDAMPLIQSEGVQKIGSDSYEIPPNGYLYLAQKKPSSLVIFNPMGGMLIVFKVSFWLGMVATSPFWLLVLMQFIAPALKKEEKRLIGPFLAVSLLFIAAGGLFAYFLTIPLANQYFASFNQTIGTNLWSLEHYLDYTLFLLLTNGLAFELCVIGIFGIHLGLFNAENLANKRRIAIVMAFILGALLTPPDVLSQLMLAIPLVLLYEALILYARLRRN